MYFGVVACNACVREQKSHIKLPTLCFYLEMSKKISENNNWYRIMYKTLLGKYYKHE